MTDAITGTARYAFSATGQAITITDALSHNITMAYALLDRPDAAIRPAGPYGR